MSEDKKEKNFGPNDLVSVNDMMKTMDGSPDGTFALVKYPRGSMYIRKETTRLKEASERVRTVWEDGPMQKPMDNEIALLQSILVVAADDYDEAHSTDMDDETKEIRLRSILSVIEAIRKNFGTQEKLDQAFGTFGLSTIVALLQQIEAALPRYFNEEQARKDFAWELYTILPLPKEIVESQMLSAPAKTPLPGTNGQLEEAEVE